MADNILLIQWMHGIGDNFFTLPAYHRVREAYPNAALSFLVEERNAIIYKGFPGLDQILTVDRSLFHESSPQEILGEIMRLIKEIRKNHYQLVIDFTSSGETGLLSLISGAKERWGLLKKQKHRFRSVYYSKTYHRTKEIHRAEGNLKLVESGGLKAATIKNHFKVPENYQQKALTLFREYGFDPDKRTLFIQPFTSDPRKDWPLEKQLQVAEDCKGKGRQVLFGGAPGERRRLKKVEERFPVAAGRADLLTTAGLMGLSTVVLGGDTGPMHMAVALGKRVIMFMGPTSPVKYGPYQHPSWVLTPERGKDLSQVTFESVLNAIEEGFNEV